jgi:glycine cleavage system regulatory protein
MARLAGQFAGIVVVSVPDDNVTALQASLDGLNAQGLLDVQVAIASSSTEDVPTENVLRLELIGQDRPGIISEISAALATRNVSILELETNTLSAPMSGEPLFEAKATLRVPNELPLDQLRETLEDIANELMVDLDLRPE